MHRFNLKTSYKAAKMEFERLVEKGSIIEMIEVKNKRTNKQNAALWLFFTQLANILNDAGLYCVVKLPFKEEEIEVNWTKERVKELIWSPLQEHFFGSTSTRKLKTKDIDIVFDAICLHFTIKGIELNFPNKFDFFYELQS